MTLVFFEEVYTVTGYYDGPRVGVADFEGAPHLYESEWNDLSTDDEPIYLLSPVDEATLELALEDRAIWLRWERARHDGETTDETHPALPSDRVRHEAIKATLESQLVTAPSPIRTRSLSPRPACAVGGQGPLAAAGSAMVENRAGDVATCASPGGLGRGAGREAPTGVAAAARF